MKLILSITQWKIVALCTIVVSIIVITYLYTVILECETNEELKPQVISKEKATKFQNMYAKGTDTGTGAIEMPTTKVEEDADRIEAVVTDVRRTANAPNPEKKYVVRNYKRGIFDSSTFQDYGTVDSFFYNADVPFSAFSGPDYSETDEYTGGRDSHAMMRSTPVDNRRSSSNTDINFKSSNVSTESVQNDTVENEIVEDESIASEHEAQECIGNLPRGEFKGSESKFGVTVTGTVNVTPLQEDGGLLNFHVLSNENPPFEAICDDIAWVIDGNTVELDTTNECFVDQLSQKGVKVTKITYENDVVTLVIKKKVLFFYVTIKLTMKNTSGVSCSLN